MFFFARYFFDRLPKDQDCHEMWCKQRRRKGGEHRDLAARLADMPRYVGAVSGTATVKKTSTAAAATSEIKNSNKHLNSAFVGVEAPPAPRGNSLSMTARDSLVAAREKLGGSSMWKSSGTETTSRAYQQPVDSERDNRSNSSGSGAGHQTSSNQDPHKTGNKYQSFSVGPDQVFAIVDDLSLEEINRRLSVLSKALIGEGNAVRGQLPFSDMPSSPATGLPVLDPDVISRLTGSLSSDGSTDVTALLLDVIKKMSFNSATGAATGGSLPVVSPAPAVIVGGQQVTGGASSQDTTRRDGVRSGGTASKPGYSDGQRENRTGNVNEGASQQRGQNSSSVEGKRLEEGREQQLRRRDAPPMPSHQRTYKHPPS